MLSLPLPASDRLKLADWLEFYALASPDGNASYIDLERAVRRGGIAGLDTDEAIEQVIQEVASELEQRAKAADRAYPFTFDSRSLSLRDSIERFTPYVFCLCLSVMRSERELDRRPFPRRMFEYLSCEAAKNYLGGEAVRFASPRQARDMPREFSRAVNELCRRVGEGGGFREKRAFSRKDDALDVVAWREFPDLAEGKLLLMGNCASGRNWNAKLDELKPGVFCEDWMYEVPVSVHLSIRAIFLPHRIDSIEWKRVSRRAGMIFDRCRIAYWVSTNDSFEDRQMYLDWAKSLLARESAL